MVTRAERQKGTASVEALLGILVLIAVLAGVAWLDRYVHASQQLLAQSHACTLHLARAGCDDKALRDPVCTGVAKTSRSLPRRTGLKKISGLAAKVWDIPIIGDAIGRFLGKLARTQNSAELDGPEGEATTRGVRGGILCGPQARSWGGHFSDIACYFVGDIPVVSGLFACKESS